MGVSTSLDTNGRGVWQKTTGSGRSSPERGGGPPKVVKGHGRGRVTYKGQETPHVPLHHASHGPPPPVGEERQLPTPKAEIAGSAPQQRPRRRRDVLLTHQALADEAGFPAALGPPFAVGVARAAPFADPQRSEELPVGQGCVSTCISRWWPST